MDEWVIGKDSELEREIAEDWQSQDVQEEFGGTSRHTAIIDGPSVKDW